jgi:F-type H+-transporting ATPase subunit delta
MEVAAEGDQYRQWKESLARIVAVLAQADVREAVANPKVAFALKRQLLEERLRGLDQRAVNLALFMVSRGKAALAPDVAREYEALLNRREGIEPAEVVSAVPLDEDATRRIAGHLSELTGKKIVLATRVDPEILGGIVARVGDQLIDGSLRYRLAELKKVLEG